MIIDEDIYLEHWGVKGMKWGIRNNQSSNKKVSKTGSKSKKLTPMQIREKRIKTLNKVVFGITATLYVASILSSLGNHKTSTIKPPKAPKAKSVADFINDRRNVEVSSLKRMHAEGKMDADQFKNFSTILNARYDRKVADALKGN